MRTVLRQQTILFLAYARIVMLPLKKKRRLLDEFLEEGLHLGRTLPNALQEVCEEWNALAVLVNGLTERDAMRETLEKGELSSQTLKERVGRLLTDGKERGQHIGLGEVVEGGERGDKC